jgi:hypothetical protein
VGFVPNVIDLHVTGHPAQAMRKDTDFDNANHPRMIYGLLD